MEILNRIKNLTNPKEEETRPTAWALGIGAVSVGLVAFFWNRNQRRFFVGGLHNRVRTIMTPNPIHCNRNTHLFDVARLMVEHNCGEIPVVEENNRPIGVITDRDIVCRTLAKRINPLAVTAESVMTTPVNFIHENAPIQECLDVMERNQIRRVLVVDDRDSLCGVVSQADVMRRVGLKTTTEVMERLYHSSAA